MAKTGALIKQEKNPTKTRVRVTWASLYRIPRGTTTARKTGVLQEMRMIVVNMLPELIIVWRKVKVSSMSSVSTSRENLKHKMKGILRSCQDSVEATAAGSIKNQAVYLNFTTNLSSKDFLHKNTFFFFVFAEDLFSLSFCCVFVLPVIF